VPVQGCSLLTFYMKVPVHKFRGPVFLYGSKCKRFAVIREVMKARPIAVQVEPSICLKMSPFYGLFILLLLLFVPRRVSSTRSLFV
jgi:hypothetical protein